MTWVYLVNMCSFLKQHDDILYESDRKGKEMCCPNDTEGTIGLAGRDEIRFTVISEDGKHHTQTRYTLVRK